MVAGGLSRTLPTLPHGGEKARRVGGGLGEGWETSRVSELSCSRASNSNHPDPSVNSNLLTLTAPDKGGLTNLNLCGGLAFSPCLPWSPVARPSGVSSFGHPHEMSASLPPRGACPPASKHPLCSSPPEASAWTSHRGLSFQGWAEAFSFKQSCAPCPFFCPRLHLFQEYWL